MLRGFSPRIFLMMAAVAGLLGFSVGLVAGALTPVTLVNASLTYDFATPGPSATSFSYGLGYLVIVQHVTGNYTVANVTVGAGAGPAVGAVSLGYGLGLGLGAESYTAGSTAVGDPAQVIVPPPATVTQTTTVTQTVTETSTVTETKTSVETRVVTTIRPETVTVDSGGGLDPGLVGLGLVFILVLASAAFALTRR